MVPPKEFIRKIRPFSFLSEDDLDIIISGLEVELFEKMMALGIDSAEKVIRAAKSARYAEPGIAF